MSHLEKKPLSVMYVLGSVSKVGGLERVITDKMNCLIDMGCKVTLVTYEQGTHPIIFPLYPSIKHIDVGVRFFQLYKESYPRRFFKNIKWRRVYLQRLQKIVNEIQPDVISTVTYDLEICDILPKLKTSAKFIIESHSAKKYTKDYRDGRSGIKLFLSNIRLHFLFHKIAKYDMLVSLTEGDATDWRRIAKRVAIIPNPITVYPEKVNVCKRNNRIIAVGRLHHQKGFDILVDAFSSIQEKCPQWQLCIYGDGEELNTLKQRIQNKSMQEYISISPPTQDIYSEYQKSDFLVMSSRYEGFGLVLVEAMACGIPCVSFDCPYGPSDIIEDGYNGLLAENGNVSDLAEKMLWMCTNTRKRQVMGDAARKSVYRYRKEQIMQKWLDLYTE